MALDHLWYTWAQYGVTNRGRSGWQVRAASGPLLKQYEQGGQPYAAYCNYELPPGMTPQLTEMPEAPITQGFIALSGRCLVYRRAYLGSEGLGRRGNHFAHLIEVPTNFSARNAIELWDWTGYRRLREELERDARRLELDPLDDRELEATHWQPALMSLPTGTLAFILTAFKERRPAQHIFVAGESAQIAVLIWALTQSFPCSLLEGLTFSTYEHVDAILNQTCTIVGTMLGSRTDLPERCYHDHLCLNLAAAAPTPIPTSREYSRYVEYVLQAVSEGRFDEIQGFVREAEGITTIDDFLKLFDLLDPEASLTAQQLKSFWTAGKAPLLMKRKDIAQLLVEIAERDPAWWKETGCRPLREQVVGRTIAGLIDGVCEYAEQRAREIFMAGSFSRADALVQSVIRPLNQSRGWSTLIFLLDLSQVGRLNRIELFKALREEGVVSERDTVALLLQSWRELWYLDTDIGRWSPEFKMHVVQHLLWNTKSPIRDSNHESLEALHTQLKAELLGAISRHGLNEDIRVALLDTFEKQLSNYTLEYLQDAVAHEEPHVIAGVLLATEQASEKVRRHQLRDNLQSLYREPDFFYRVTSAVVVAQQSSATIKGYLDWLRKAPPSQRDPYYRRLKQVVQQNSKTVGQPHSDRLFDLVVDWVWENFYLLEPVDEQFIDYLAKDIGETSRVDERLLDRIIEHRVTELLPPPLFAKFVDSIAAALDEPDRRDTFLHSLVATVAKWNPRATQSVLPILARAVVSMCPYNVPRSLTPWVVANWQSFSQELSATADSTKLHQLETFRRVVQEETRAPLQRLGSGAETIKLDKSNSEPGFAASGKHTGDSVAEKPTSLEGPSLDSGFAGSGGQYGNSSYPSTDTAAWVPQHSSENGVRSRGPTAGNNQRLSDGLNHIPSQKVAPENRNSPPPKMTAQSGQNSSGEWNSHRRPRERDQPYQQRSSQVLDSLFLYMTTGTAVVLLIFLLYTFVTGSTPQAPRTGRSTLTPVGSSARPAWQPIIGGPTMTTLPTEIPGTTGVTDDPLYREHRVRPGETLESVAREHLGDGSRWRELRYQNGSCPTNPNILAVGQMILIPTAPTVPCP